jgi:hypothetical protein
MDTILAIDIGIKHLSMCILNKESILLWDIFNVIKKHEDQTATREEHKDDEEHKCHGVQKNGKSCNKKPSYVDKEQTGYCKTHAPENSKLLKTNGNRRFPCAKVKDVTIHQLTRCILDSIESIYNDNKEVLDSVSRIVIELQPSVNQKMKFVSHIVYGKFTDMFKSTPVQFIGATQKLKLVYNGPELKCDLKNSYSKRKWLSIEYTKWFLEHHFSEEQKQCWLPLFLSHKKKDDMADCFLYCLKILKL